MKKKQLIHCLNVIKTALRYWDPLNVLNLSNKEDLVDNEYDSYASGILKHLENGTNLNGITNHLTQLRIVSMASSDQNPSDNDKLLAEILIAWRDNGYKDEPDFSSIRK